MARTAIVPQVPTRSGLAITFAPVDAANGNSVPNNGRRLLRFKNTGGSAVTVTVAVGRTIDGQTAAGKTIVVPPTTGDIITSVWSPSDYSQPDGNLYLDYSSGTGMTVAAIDV